jgi:hypothetical protein
MAERQFLKLSLEEKDFLDRIVSISCVDKTVVKEVLQAILKMITIELYADFNTIYIPYICSLNVTSYENLSSKGVETIVELEATPSKNLIEEVIAISEGEITPTQEYTRQKIYKSLEDKIEE